MLGFETIGRTIPILQIKKKIKHLGKGCQSMFPAVHV